MSQDLTFGGVSVGEMYQKLIESGVQRSDAAVIASSWIFENIAGTQRTFSYAQAFPASDAGCAIPPFRRTFEHRDWYDGQSVVQAEETPDEAGFNLRFHQIEADLDSLGGDVATLVTCLAAMRSSLRKLLDEIRAELNRLNADVHGRRPKGTSTTGKSPYYTMIDQTKYLGTQKFMDKDVYVYETPTGTLMLPIVENIGAEVLTSRHLRAAAMVKRYVIEHEDVREKFSDKVSVDEFVDVYGDAVLADGRAMREVLKVVPARSEYEDVDALLTDISEREAAIVRTTTGGVDAVSAALGLGETEVADIGAAEVTRLTTVPPQALEALRKGGVETIEALATTPADKLVTVLAKSDYKVSAGQAAEWSAFAETITRMW